MLESGEGSSTQAAASSAGSEEWYYLKEGLSYSTVNGNTGYCVNPPVKVDSGWI